MKSLVACQSGGCRAMLDTGTSLLQVAPNVASALSEAVPVETDCSNKDRLPDLHFALSGENFRLGPNEYVVRQGGACSLGVSDIDADHWSKDDLGAPALILGQIFLRSHYTVYDMESGRVGI